MSVWFWFQDMMHVGMLPFIIAAGIAGILIPESTPSSPAGLHHLLAAVAFFVQGFSFAVHFKEGHNPVSLLDHKILVGLAWAIMLTLLWQCATSRASYTVVSLRSFLLRLMAAW